MPLHVDREIHQPGSQLDVTVVTEIGAVLAVQPVLPVLATLIGSVLVERAGPMLAVLVGSVLIGSVLIGSVLIGSVLIGSVLVEVGPVGAEVGPDGGRCGCGPVHGHDPAGRPAATASGLSGADRERSNRSVGGLAHPRIFIMFYQDLS
ncbi:hypothetical protein [Plantactinospora mayteni]|uniref:Integral membrane protein n=1 Tax=Plantactinospora mayteni TaxID=566021 RepID=A0ABQ4EZI4_9ACTN|nr:hypothetical protein [Plantactinospora mayteni]GIH00084.1 hypothetical protein Pma05_66560 [Plantactinospora mayteni]